MSTLSKKERKLSIMVYRITDHYKPYHVKAPKYSDEEILFVEESEAAISNLLDLTLKNKISWTCTHYMPVDDMPADTQTRLYLWHSFDVETDYNGQHIILDMGEIITLPSGRGDLSLEYKPMWYKDYTYDTRVSDRFLNFDRFRLSCLNNLCSLDSVTQLFDLIIPNVMDSPAIQKGFEMKAVYSEKPPCIQNHPMYILAKHLREDKRALDFHKCIFDLNYRKLLYNEYHIKEPLT